MQDNEDNTCERFREREAGENLHLLVRSRMPFLSRGSSFDCVKSVHATVRSWNVFLGIQWNSLRMLRDTLDEVCLQELWWYSTHAQPLWALQLVCSLCAVPACRDRAAAKPRVTLAIQLIEHSCRICPNGIQYYYRAKDYSESNCNHHTELNKSPISLAVSKVNIRPNPSDRFPVVSIRITAKDSVTRAIPPSWEAAPIKAYFPGSAQA